MTEKTPRREERGVLGVVSGSAPVDTKYPTHSLSNRQARSIDRVTYLAHMGEELIAEIAIGAEQCLRITTDRRKVHFRVWFRPRFSGDVRPSKAGVSFPKHKLADVIGALQRVGLDALQGDARVPLNEGGPDAADF